MPEVGTYTLPVILSFEGVDKQVNSKLGRIFGDVGKKGGNDLAKGASSGLKTLTSDVDSAAKAYGKLRDRASDALGKVRIEEEKLKAARSSGKDAQIIAAEERLAKARRDSNRASREATDGHKALQAASSASTASAVAAGGAMGKLSGLTAGAGAALASAGAIAGGAALAGIAALTAGVVVAGNRLYDLGAQFDDLSDNLQIKTGLSGDALKNLKESVERLGTTNVPSTFGEIGNVAAEVTRSLHLTGPAFDDVTSRLANLQRMGVDVDVRSLGKAFRGFGVEAKNQSGALNSLYEASTKSGLSIDDLTGAVAKGGPALRQLGLNFGQSAALIANFEQAGLDGEKGMTALTKATTYFAKENIPAKQGLQDTITQIQKLGDTPEAADLANKVFGAKGGAAFYEAIQNGTLDLQSLSDSLQTTGIDINKVSEDTADWSEKWQDLKNEVEVALEPMASGLFDAVNDELGGLADSLVDHKADIVDFFTTLGDIAITGAENMAHGIGGILQAFGDLVGGVGNVKGVLDDLMGDFATLRGDDAAAAAFHASAQEAYGWGESLRAAGDKLANLNLDGLRQGLHNVGDAAKNSSEDVGGLGSALGALPTDKNINVHANTGPANADMQAWLDKWKSVIVSAPTPATPPPVVPSLTDPNRPQLGGHHATGGPIRGAGGPKSDIIPIWASNGEHMLTASDVQAMGGQGGVYAFRNALHRQTGGPIWPMAIMPTPTDPRRNAERGRPSQFPDRGPEGKIRYKGPYNYGGDRPGPGLWEGGTGSSGAPSPNWWMPKGKGLIRFPWEPKNPLDPWIWNRKGVSGLGSGLGYANGGAVLPGQPGSYVVTPDNIMSAMQFAESVNGKPYSYGGTGPLYDCSGFMSAIYGMVTGKPLPAGQRYFTTESDFTKLGFVKGFDPNSPFNIGVHNGGGGMNSHMAGTLAGYNVESGGSAGMTQFGGSAAGANNPQFENQYHLPGNISALQAGPDGQTGTYTSDPTDVADAQARVTEAEGKIREAEAKQKELEADAKESERISAQNDVDKAKADADKARRDLEEAKKGKFEAAKTDTGTGSSKDSPLKEGLGILAGGLKETLGIGDWLPDLADNPWLKGADAAIGAGVEMVNAYANGTWTPGGLLGDAMGTSNSPFGMPDVQAPPMPPNGVHTGSGMAPGPMQNVTIDQSQNFNNSPVGWDPERVNKERDRNISMRTIPRIGP